MLTPEGIPIIGLLCEELTSAIPRNGSRRDSSRCWRGDVVCAATAQMPCSEESIDYAMGMSNQAPRGLVPADEASRGRANDTSISGRQPNVRLETPGV
jgi:hypothetical protein